MLITILSATATETSSIPGGIQGVLFAIGIVLALLNCFYGFKLLKFFCVLISFCIGAIAGFGISIPMTNSTPISTLIAIIVGLLIVGIVLKTYQCGIFLLCGGLTYLIIELVIAAFPLSITRIVITITAIILSVLVGILAVKSAESIVILITGISGGLVASHSLLLFWHLNNAIIATVIGIVIAIIGIWFQWKNIDTKKE